MNLDSILKEAYENAVENYRTRHSAETEREFQCLVYHYLLSELKSPDLIGVLLCDGKLFFGFLLL